MSGLIGGYGSGVDIEVRAGCIFRYGHGWKSADARMIVAEGDHPSAGARLAKERDRTGRRASSYDCARFYGNRPQAGRVDGKGDASGDSGS